MFIKQLIVDGFKSYGTRTVISGWDPSFTAITGENGSGKSNILDAICFVLGISQLSQVRAGSLRDLVYKQGQAGITKASVTILFDNSDPASSPIGYEQSVELTITRQVVVNGKNKYLINGHTAQLNRVQNLFQSVQLNIANPTFLVMQGRITKVLNMKPIEILGLIEEAAGTKMFEAKKIAACATMNKKQLKVAEINTILTEDITPQLEKLRRECALFNKWSANVVEIQRMERRAVAHRFWQAEQSLNDSSDREKALQKAVDDLQEGHRTISNEIDVVDRQMEVHDAAGDAQNTINQMKEAVTESAKNIVLQTSTLDFAQQSVNDEMKNDAQIQKALDQAQLALTDRRKAHQELLLQHDNIVRAKNDVQAQIDAFQGREIGVAVKNEGAGSLLAQLMDAKQSQTETTSAVSQAQARLQQLRQDITVETENAQRCAPAHRALLDERSKLEVSIDSDTKQLASYDPDSLSSQLRELDNDIYQRKSEVDRLQNKVNQLTSQTSRFNFDYSPPNSRFNPASVKGRVAKRIQIKDTSNAVALEVVAGGRLYNVIVDTHHTSAALLKDGRLRSRVTILPLNKISSSTIPQDIIRRASDLVGPDNVGPATSLITYDDEVAAAINYVFGNTFICRDSESAKAITFDRQIRKRSVTLQGDQYDPSGTLSGGSRPNHQPSLMILHDLSMASAELDDKTASLKEVHGRRSLLKQRCDAARALIERIEEHQSQLGILNHRIESSSSFALIAKIESLKEDVRSTELLIAESESTSDRLAAKISSIQSRLDDDTPDDVDIEKLDADLLVNNNKVADVEQKCRHAELDVEQKLTDIAALEESHQASLMQIETLKAKVDECNVAIAAVKAGHGDLERRLEAAREVVREATLASRSLAKRRDHLSSELADAELQIKTAEHRLARFSKDEEGARNRIEQCLESDPWIDNERHQFGRANTAFDFEASPPSQEAAKLAQLQKDQAEMGKNINRQVVGLMRSAEDKYQALLTRRDITKKDKEKIERVIEELDRNKNQLLQDIWEKVNRDFGKIFSTLLPGAFAKLQPPTGGTVLDGLEVRVSFGGIWKESLSELSGGQRSLLALSLILSLLLYKPAPMYILDEVDAALDLSHTQNIGQIIKTHFAQSQFIVVSLKEGMFNNANVILRTKFVNGVSTVSMNKSNA